MKPTILIALAICVSGCGPRRTAKNAIIFIGDAAGIGVLNAAAIHGGKPQGLFIQQMPHLGLMETSAAVEWVTDSAAAATAIATGHKTRNGVIAQSDAAVRGVKDGEPLKSVLEYAEERGLSTGLVTNDQPSGATPSAWYAHSNDRKKKGAMMAQLLTPRFGDGPDVVIGAERAAVLEETQAFGIDIESGLRGKGYVVADSLEKAPPDANRIVVLMDNSDYDLGPAVDRAISILSRNPKGFFLMVESDLHTKVLSQGLVRALAFDSIIRKTAERMKDDTLIVFTADHSFDTRLTAGRRGDSLLSQPVAGDGDAGAKPIMRIGDGHTGEEVLVAAQGPGAERVRGFFPNTRLFEILIDAYGWPRP